MKRNLVFAASVLALIASPFIASAFAASVTTSVGSTPTGSPINYRICSILPQRALTVGARGDDVRSLQEFLSTQGYLHANATGYFGVLTKGAVAQWQTSEGVSAVGSFGPISRTRILSWCGNLSPTPQPYPSTCKPLTYMPIRCEDGSAAQPVHNESGCLTGYECPVANYTPPANCKAWSDGCNSCARTSPGSDTMCTMRACFAAGKGYCSVYFDSPSTQNKAPTISSFSGPTTLGVNTSGTWTILASDPENQSLTYSIQWGDKVRSNTMAAMPMIATDAFVQTTTFTHAYSAAGTYTVQITVRDAFGSEAQTSSTVRVGADGVVCTMQYAPVCGQPPEPACRRSIPACMIATQGPHTYGNRCEMNAAGATYIHDGACDSSAY